MYNLNMFEIREVSPKNIPSIEHNITLNGIYSHGQLVATAGAFNHSGSEDIKNLIAAAPDLLEALVSFPNEAFGLVDFVINIQEWHKNKVIPAIAKAKGETK